MAFCGNQWTYRGRELAFTLIRFEFSVLKYWPAACESKRVASIILNDRHIFDEACPLNGLSFEHTRTTFKIRVLTNSWRPTNLSHSVKHWSFNLTTEFRCLFFLIRIMRNKAHVSSFFRASSIPSLKSPQILPPVFFVRQTLKILNIVWF